MHIYGFFRNLSLRTECLLLKAGAFRSIAAAYPVRKLHPNSHLYTSDTFIENFPGRIFRIVNQCSFNKKEVKENLADLKKQM